VFAVQPANADGLRGGNEEAEVIRQIITLAISVFSLAAAILWGIQGAGYIRQNDELRADVDALKRDCDEARRRHDALMVCSGDSHRLKNLRINQLEKRNEAYEREFGPSPYSNGQIPE
jgi:hypothetical protein